MSVHDAPPARKDAPKEARKAAPKAAPKADNSGTYPDAPPSLPPPPSLPVPPSLPPATRRVVLLANYLSSFVAGLAIGGMVPFLSLVLEGRGVSATVIGANSSLAACGIICVAPLVPFIVRRFGLVRSVIVGVFISVAALLLMGAFESLIVWFILRPIAAGGFAIHWVVSETWINTVTTRRDRGRILSIYVAAISAGVASGSLVLSVIGAEGWTPFVAFGLILSLATVPLVLIGAHAPKLEGSAMGTPLFLARHAPTVLAAVILVGLYDGACFSLLPIYGLRAGLGEAEAVLLLSAFIAGAMFFQLPFGWLADRISHRVLLLVCAAIAFGGPLIVPSLIGTGMLLMAVASLWGGAVFAFYTLGLTMLGDRFTGGDLATGNAAFVMSFESASAFGPLIAGAAMERWEPHGMMGFLAAIAAIFALVTILRGMQRMRHGDSA